MIISNLSSKAVINIALRNVNGKYQDNIKLLKGEPINACGTRWRVRLGVWDSSSVGASINPNSGRKISAACWHVHGMFFTEVYKLCPSCKIYTYNTLVDKVKPFRDYERRTAGIDFTASEWCECTGGAW